MTGTHATNSCAVYLHVAFPWHGHDQALDDKALPSSKCALHELNTAIISNSVAQVAQVELRQMCGGASLRVAQTIVELTYIMHMAVTSAAVQAYVKTDLSATVSTCCCTKPLV
jgi:hypothetical protein